MGDVVIRFDKMSFYVSMAIANKGDILKFLHHSFRIR